MAAPISRVLLRSSIRNLTKLNGCLTHVPVACYCERLEDKKSRFKFDIESLKKADDDVEDLPIEEESVSDEKEPESFASMFRRSAFVQLGSAKEQAVAGRIFDVVDDDLYIDFGGKFYCVCPRPSYQAELYVKGQRVKLMMNKFEMSSSFLGSDKHVTLLEADCTLMGLFDPPLRESRSSLPEKTTLRPGGYAEKMLSEESRTARKEKVDIVEEDT